MENEDFIYAAVVCKNNESDFVYYEAMSFLGKLYSKKNIFKYSYMYYRKL